jgi:hypothetical protein
VLLCLSTAFGFALIGVRISHLGFNFKQINSVNDRYEALRYNKLTKAKSTTSLQFSLIILFSSVTAFAQSPSQLLLNELNRIIAKENIPSAMISIVRSGSIIYTGGVGFANLEKRGSWSYLVDFAFRVDQGMSGSGRLRELT